MYGNLTQVPKNSDFSALITPQTLGILWINSPNSLLDDPLLVPVNYLFDGLLIKSLNRWSFSSNFILGKNFGNPFFLGLLNNKIKAPTKEVDQILSIAEGLSQKSNRIVLLGKWDPGQINRLKRSYHHFSFVTP